MRALTLLEPWATLVARGLKTVETRGRELGLRVDEEFLVHAGRKEIDAGLSDDVLRAADLDPYYFEPQYGKVVAFATVKAVEDCDGGLPFAWTCPLNVGEAVARKREYALGDYRPGRVLYQLHRVQRLLEPCHARGMQGVWTPEPHVLEQLAVAARTSYAR
jgi:hypothetical protein